MAERDELTMELRHAQGHDVPSLKVLWHTCFGDDKPYINLFFNNLFRPEDMVVLEEDGTVVSMAALLDAPIQVDGERVSARYLYAMCTHPEHRGKGYARKLLDYAAEYCRLLGAAAITLVPSEPSLFHFYRQAGYETAFWSRFHTATHSLRFMANGWLLPVTAAMYNKIRRETLKMYSKTSFRKNLAFVDYSDAFIEHQLQVCAMAGGGLLRFDTHNGTGCAAVEKGENGICKLKELVMPPCSEDAAFILLLKNPRTRIIEARGPELPGDRPLEDSRPFGMVKWLTLRRWKLERAFLGLALD